MSCADFLIYKIGLPLIWYLCISNSDWPGLRFRSIIIANSLSSFSCHNNSPILANCLSLHSGLTSFIIKYANWLIFNSWQHREIKGLVGSSALLGPRLIASQSSLPSGAFCSDRCLAYLWHCFKAKKDTAHLSEQSGKAHPSSQPPMIPNLKPKCVRRWCLCPILHPPD